MEKPVIEANEKVGTHSTPSTEIRRQRDSCTAVAGDLRELMKV